MFDFNFSVTTLCIAVAKQQQINHIAKYLFNYYLLNSQIMIKSKEWLLIPSRIKRL